MVKEIRRLNREDIKYLEMMDTGIEDDYIERIFERLTSGGNRLYGLFMDRQMVSMGGYSLYAGYYAMLGRLRTDRRFRGKDYATELLTYVLKEASLVKGIQWIGGNTQENNESARRVLEKIGLSPCVKHHGAVAEDVSGLMSGATPWKQVHSRERKMEWLRKTYINSSAVFPYECYYSFPATEYLFEDEKVEEWAFFENENETRFLITKYDRKKNHYLHTVYPWSDMAFQEGFWETISKEYFKLVNQMKENTYIWIDLTPEEAITLPASHKFRLPSPWILYGQENIKVER